MLGVAIDISRSDRPDEFVDCSVPLRRMDAPHLVRHIGSRVLLFRPGGAQTDAFVASAILGGIVPRVSHSPALAAQLTEIAAFAQPVVRPATMRREDAAWVALPRAVFTAILEGGENRRDLEEAAAEFLHEEAMADGLPELDTFRALGEAVLRNYGYSCAMTGQSEAGRSEPPGRPQVEAIRPRSLGGEVHVTNCIALAPAAAQAFAAGHITLTDDLRMIVDMSRIDPELVEKLNPLGYLTAPRDESLGPSRASLEWHREQVFQGQL